MFKLAWDTAANFTNLINQNLGKHQPATIIAGTIATTLFLQKSYQLYQNWDTAQIKKSLMNNAVQSLEHLPYIGSKITSKINEEVNGILSGIKTDVDAARSEWVPIEVLPTEGLSADVIKERFKNLQTHYKPGRLSGAVYAEYDEKVSELLQFVWGCTALTNPMHSEWPLINLMEAEVISMCQNLLHGQSGAPGMMTNGGSTSIFEACKAYVLKARADGIKNPVIVVPENIHVSFDKAAKTLNATLVKVAVNKTTGAADPKAMDDIIYKYNRFGKRVCMLAGSAPSFPFGIIDPITELGKIALKHGVPLHVDACLGGFLTVFAKEAGFSIPACDFSVPGVNSISIDTHKYGQTPKGTSVLLFSQNFKATPTHVHLDWPGGMYVTPGINGSRSGADIATAWALLCHKGRRAYVKTTKEILTLQRNLLSKIKNIDGIYVPYHPQLSVVPIQCKENINSSLVADRLRLAGWSVNILQTLDQKSSGFHFCLTTVHVHQQNFLSDFINDLTDAVAYAKDNPHEQPKGIAKAYGKLEKGVPQFVQERIGNGYNRILNTLPNITIPGIWTQPTNPKLNPSAKKEEENHSLTFKNS